MFPIFVVRIFRAYCHERARTFVRVSYFQRANSVCHENTQQKHKSNLATLEQLMGWTGARK